MSLFISFEGGEGTGKTTQVKLLAEQLKSHGYRIETIHEPGGTDLGDYVRDWVKATNKPLTPEAELFLFAAARAELVRRIITPGLKRGVTIIADRYADSTTVYQGYAREVPIKSVDAANALATDGVWPNLTILLDLPNGVGLGRTRLQAGFDEHGRIDVPGRPEDGDKRRFEEASEDFHRRVHDGYLQLAEQEAERWFVVDAQEPVETIAERIWTRIIPLLDQRANNVGEGRLPGF